MSEPTDPPTVAPDDDDVDPLDEVTGTHPVPGLDVARHLSEIRRTLRKQTEILRAVEGFLERLTAIEEERVRHGTLWRGVCEAVRGGADRLAGLVERALEPQALAGLGVIVRWVALMVVALAAIVYGVSLTGWGVTLGTQLGDAMGITEPSDPVDTGIPREARPVPGEPRPSP